MVLKRYGLHAAVALSAAMLWTGNSVANVIGHDAQNFNPVVGAGDFVTVQSSAVLDPGRFHLGLFVNHATNSLPYTNDDHQGRTRMNDALVGMDMVIGAGVLPNLELGVALPFVVHQRVGEDETRGEFAERGNTEVRPVVKWAFLRRSDFGLAVLGSANVGRVQDDPHAGSATGPVYNLELAGDLRLGRMTLGANLGYRRREPGERIDGALIAPLRNQMLASTALAYGLNSKTSVVSEIYGSRVLGNIENETDRQGAAAELLLGVRQRFNPRLFGHAGAGTELLHGLATPDWRLYAGLTTEIGLGGRPSKASLARRSKKQRQRAQLRDKAPQDVTMATYDNEGPGAESMPTEEPDEVFVLRNINFEFDSDYRVLQGAIAEMEKLVRHLEKRPYTKLVIEGHTDYYGSDEYNDDLSMRRARTVRRHLIKYHGVNPEEIIAVGYGERRPLTDDPSDAGRQINRRVEIKIYRD